MLLVLASFLMKRRTQAPVTSGEPITQATAWNHSLCFQLTPDCYRISLLSKTIIPSVQKHETKHVLLHFVLYVSFHMSKVKMFPINHPAAITKCTFGIPSDDWLKAEAICICNERQSN